MKQKRARPADVWARVRSTDGFIVWADMWPTRKVARHAQLMYFPVDGGLFRLARLRISEVVKRKKGRRKK